LEKKNAYFNLILDIKNKIYFILRMNSILESSNLNSILFGKCSNIFILFLSQLLNKTYVSKIISDSRKT
jgi:hypothetical protein